MFAESISTIVTESNTAVVSTNGYSSLLQDFGISFKSAENYWQVGDIKRTQGWILHITVVLYQIEELLKLVIPYLKSREVSFKIIQNEKNAEDLLNGNLGLAQIGKIVSIYPEDDADTLSIARELISLTSAFKGPFIPTDICLGNIIYTRYGGFKPIIKLNAAGQQEKYIYDERGNLIKDAYEMPFRLPQSLTWPFDSIIKPALPEAPALLNRIYKPIELLKMDPKGNVFRGLYVKGLLRVKNCVIKQGFRNMYSDSYGRDIRDRLLWQYELHKALTGIVPLPEIYNIFEEKGYTVLVMEWIKGVSLFDKAIQINPLFVCWRDLQHPKRQLLLQYVIDIAQAIHRMHQMGYVHRDVVPVNFMVDKKNRIKLIDIELAYSLKENRPDPPFTLGTYGFMSPEQEAIQRPTIEEDIYGLGATVICLLTGIFPVKFNTKSPTEFAKSLEFFINDSEIASILASSVHEEPKSRPSVPDIVIKLTAYSQRLSISKNIKSQRHPFTSNSMAFQDLILVALQGLTEPPIIIKDNLWCSKLLTAENYTSRENRQYEISPGLADGISGVLFMLATLHEAGIDISPCKLQYDKCWSYLQQILFSNITKLSPSLFQGAPGVALTIAKNIGSGMFGDNEQLREKLVACLSLANDQLNFANGIAGVGLAIVRCRAYLPTEFYRTSLNSVISTLLSRQREDGLWMDPIENNSPASVILNFKYDNTGIIWFLLELLVIDPNPELEKAIHKAIDGILGHRAHMKYLLQIAATQESYEVGDGGKGLIVTLMYAYEVFKDIYFKEHAIILLSKYPHRVAHHNFSQENGLAAIGELYLEAWRVFKDQEWKSRAEWIAALLANCVYRIRPDSGLWVMEQNNPPTAGFLTGNSGVIHFLARFWKPDKIKYRLLK
jgi:serine/threonine protein kinase